MAAVCCIELHTLPRSQGARSPTTQLQSAGPAAVQELPAVGSKVDAGDRGDARFRPGMIAARYDRSVAKLYDKHVIGFLQAQPLLSNTRSGWSIFWDCRQGTGVVSDR